MMQAVRSRSTHDVVVIGSGASGGMAAFNLTRKGVKVLLLDAGGVFSRDDFWTHVPAFEADARRRSGDAPPPHDTRSNAAESLFRTLEAQINNGVLKEGEPLPPEREIVDRLA